MPDIRLVPVATPDVVTWDWLQTPAGLLDETNELITAVLIAFNSDAVAAPSDVLPDPRSDDRRGWWGDMDAATIWSGWPLGSKLWLLTRASIVDQNAREGATVTRAATVVCSNACSPSSRPASVRRSMSKYGNRRIATIASWRASRSIAARSRRSRWSFSRCGLNCFRHRKPTSKTRLK